MERLAKYEWDYLYGSLEVTEGQAHFAHLPTVSLGCDALYLEDLAASDPEAVHVVIRDNAGFHLRDATRACQRYECPSCRCRLTARNAIPASRRGT